MYLLSELLFHQEYEAVVPTRSEMVLESL